MRSILVLVHRYAGLLIAAFLFMSGVTGAIISWDHELDDLLNPHLMEAKSEGPRLDPLHLAREVEARDARVKVSFVPLNPEAGESLGFGVSPVVDPTTGRLFEPGYNEVFVDPASGEELGRREWGGVWPISRENLVSFLYVLHYSLHIPEMWGTDRVGLWLLGGIAIIWMLDSFVGFYLTLPAKRRAREAQAVAYDVADEETSQAAASRTWMQRWRPSWNVRWKGGGTKLNFDLHRAFSLWTWLLLFILAFTAFSLNLYSEVFYPIMSRVSQVTPSPFDVRTPQDIHQPIVARAGYGEIIDRARAEAQSRGWKEPVGSVFYSQEYGIYGVSFFKPGDDHGAAGVGPPVLYFDGGDARLLGDSQPWKGTAADLFVQAQFPLHSGRILGLPGRILISIMGLVVAMLSVTGVVIWAKKRRSQLKKKRREVPERDEVGEPARV
jgi:uncharacterized iron-regulated membrane protein